MLSKPFYPLQKSKKLWYGWRGEGDGEAWEQEGQTPSASLSISLPLSLSTPAGLLKSLSGCFLLSKTHVFPAWVCLQLFSIRPLLPSYNVPYRVIMIMSKDVLLVGSLIVATDVLAPPLAFV